MTTAQQVIYERPPEGMARGRLPVPWWVVIVLTAVIVGSAIIFLILRFVVAPRVAKNRALPPNP